MRNNSAFVLVSLFFFFSGFAALTYQIIWMRLLLQTFGNTTYSVVAVLAAFMAGLGLGGYIFGAFSQRLRNPVKIFGLIECGVGVLALFMPTIFQFLNEIYRGFATGTSSASDFLLFKFVATFLIILPATTLMGGTLPVMVRSLVSTSRSHAALIGKLYGINTLGSIAGALITAFISIELFGLTTTVYLTAVINFALLVGALFTSNNFLNNPADEKIILNKPLSTNGKSSIVILLYGLSGITSMALEILWTRLLTPTVGTYIYAFSAILAVFLLGLALGAFFYARVGNRFKETFSFLGYAQLVIALSAFFSIIVLSTGLIPLQPILHTIFVIFPATFAMGTILPAISTLSHKNELGSFLGKALLFNSFGSVIGPILAGFVLIPFFGSSRSVLLIVVLSACFSTILLLLEPRPGGGIFRRVLPVGTLFFAIVLLSTIVFGYDTIFSLRFIKYQKALHSRSTQKLLEDEAATVFAYTNPNQTDKGLIIDGVETTRLVAETKLIAHLPLLVHKNPQDVLIIALGMGTTFRSSLTHPVASVDVVELVPSVAKMFTLFHPDAAAVLADTRGKIIINDGRQYVRITQKKYDVVTIDPPPPINSAGTTVLYSQEFYQDLKSLLKPDGLVGQWFFFDTTTQEDELKMLIKTFIDEFPYVLVFKSPNSLGISIIGSSSALTFSPEHIKTQLAQLKVNRDLLEWPNTPVTLADFQSLYIGDKNLIEKYVGLSEKVTDSHPRTEYFLLRRLLATSAWIDPIELTKRLELLGSK